MIRMTEWVCAEIRDQLLYRNQELCVGSRILYKDGGHGLYRVQAIGLYRDQGHVLIKGRGMLHRDQGLGLYRDQALDRNGTQEISLHRV